MNFTFSWKTEKAGQKTYRFPTGYNLMDNLPTSVSTSQFEEKLA
jgi:hypothetical protein